MSDEAEVVVVSGRGGKRRNVIETHDAQIVAVVSLVVATVLAILSTIVPVSPTGATTADAVVMFVFAGFLAWAGASAPWWAVVVFGGIATVLSGPSWWTPVAAGSVVIGLWIGMSKVSSPWLRSAATGLALVGMMRAQRGVLFDDAPFATTAVLVGVSCVAFAVIAVSRRPRPVRRRVLLGVAGCAAASVLASVGLAAGGLQARDDLEAGRQSLTDGLEQLRRGDTVEAAVSLRAAAEALRSAGDSTNAFWTQPSRLIPVVAQHRALLAGVVQGAERSATAAADALEVADIEQLQVVNGTVDIDALASLAEPLAQLDNAVQSIRDVLTDTDSPWLLGGVRERVDTGLREIDQAAVQATATAAAARVGPAVLGADETRTYLVVFTSAGEARGQSGLMGNWAEIEVKHGRIRQTGFGRTSELIADLTVPGSSDLDPSDVQLQASDEYFDLYGPYGAGAVDVPVTPKYWSNVTMSPDAVQVAEVMAQMYEGGGRGAVDGVFVIDATGLSALLRVVGPVTVSGFDQQITADSLEQFLLLDQYRLDEITRRDLLEAVAGITLEQFLSAELPEPQQLARTLGPAATEGHIVGWAVRPEEQALFRLMGMSGQLPMPAGRDGLAIVTNNAGGNKIDSFLQRTVTYDATYDSTSGGVRADVTVTLDNAAPSSGFPDYVIGNIVGLPSGTNRSLLTVYTPLAVSSASLDGEPIGVTTGTERGWNTATVLVDIPANSSRTLHFELVGVVSSDHYEFVWRPQPLIHTDVVALDVRDDQGDHEVVYSGEITRLTSFDHGGTRALR